MSTIHTRDTWRSDKYRGIFEPETELLGNSGMRVRVKLTETNQRLRIFCPACR